MGKLDRAVKKMGQEHKAMRRQLKRSVSATSAVAMLRNVITVKGVLVIVTDIDSGVKPDDIRAFIDELCNNNPAVVFLVSDQQRETWEDCRLSMSAGVSPDVEDEGFDAGVWVQMASALVGGAYEGTADRAEGVGAAEDQEHLGRWIEVVREYAINKIKEL